MVKLVFNKVRELLRLRKHRIKWRNLNSHNYTIATTFFPVSKVKVGHHSYGDLHIISYGEDNEGLEIGHYVSIANGVKFLLGGNHFYKRFTTYPFIAKFKDNYFVETWSKGKIIVEDDAWIGTEAFIMPGVRIGKGAIVGARAVVATDVPPYSIVTGNPAVVVKYRFNEDSIRNAAAVDFSRLDPATILNNLEFYESANDFEQIVQIIKDATNKHPK